MTRKFRTDLAWLVLLCASLVTCPALAAPELTIAVPSVVVKDFPVLLKLQIDGPGETSTTHPMIPCANMDLILRPMESQNELGNIIQVRQCWTEIGEDERDTRRVLMKAGERITSLFDISSAHLQRGPALRDIPDGHYLLQVRQRANKLLSNLVPLQIVSPTGDEKAYHAKVVKLLEADRNPGHSPRFNRIWNVALLSSLPMHSIDTSSLGEAARSQMAFHRLLSLFLSTRQTPDKAQWEVMETWSVPPYLELDKQEAVVEFHIIEGQADDNNEKIAALLQKDPGYGWVLQKAKRKVSDLAIVRLSALARWTGKYK